MSAFPSAPPRTSFFAAKQGALTGTRYLFLDELRGLAILNMILFHLCWNIDHLLNIPLPWYHGTAAHVWQLYICGSFLLLAGMCIHYTRRLARHILTLGGAAVLITVVTYLAGSETLIVFGILHCMTLCFLCYLLLRPLLLRLPAIPGLVLALMLFLFTYHVPQHFLGIGPFQITLPSAWYVSYWLSLVGLLSPRFLFGRLFPHLPVLIPVSRRIFSGKAPFAGLDAQVPLPPARLAGTAQPNHLSASSAHPIWCDAAIFPRINQAPQAICGASCVNMTEFLS